MSPYDRAHTTSFNFSTNYVSILYRFRDTASYLLKVADFNPPPPAFGAPIGCDLGRISQRSLATEKINCQGYRVVFVCVILCLAILVDTDL